MQPDVGQFTVNQAVYGPHNYVQTLDATFTQFCDGASAPLTGEISIANPPPPPPLALKVSIDSSGNVNLVSGLATVTGTLSCNEPTSVFLNGIVAERITRLAEVQGSFGSAISCMPGQSPIRWSGSVMTFGSVPFGPGRAQVSVTSTAFDPNYGTFITQQQQAIVTLTGKK